MFAQSIRDACGATDVLHRAPRVVKVHFQKTVSSTTDYQIRERPAVQAEHPGQLREALSVNNLVVW